MRKFLPLLLLLVSLLASCRYKLEDGVNWDSRMLTPLVKSSVTIKDALTDTTYVRTNPDNTIKVVFRDTVVNISLSDYVKVPDTTFRATVTLDSLRLATDSLKQRITLGQMAHELVAQGNPFGNVILTNQGNTLPFIPALTGISSGEIAVDASSFFTEADLMTGDLYVKIDNQLAVDIDHVRFYLRNSGALSDTLIKRTMTNIPSGTSKEDSASLAGKTVESTMAGALEDMATNAATNVLIDTNSFVELTIIVKNLTASRATAVFPAQTVVDDDNNIKYYFPNGVELTRFKVRSGDLNLDVISTIQDTLEFWYFLPSAIKDGQSVSTYAKLAPPPPGDTTHYIERFDMADHFIDLSLYGDSANLFPQRLIGNLVYSGNLVTMDLEDSIYIDYGLVNVIPEYAEGYLGDTMFTFNESIDFDFFNSIGGGTVNLARPTVQLVFENSIGVDGELMINNVVATNSRNGSSVTLTAPFIGTPTLIPGPRLPNIGQTVSTRLALDKGNSNIRDFISGLPDKIDFDLSVHANKYGNPDLRDNFATYDSRISAFMDMEVPLEGVADHIVLQDTLDLDLSEAALPKEVLDGNLDLILTNDFPMEAEAQFYFYDAVGNLIDSLFTAGPGIIPAGTMNSVGYVEVPGYVKLSAFFDHPRVDRLKSMAKTAIARFTLSTKPVATDVKIYTTYGIDFRIVGDFRFQVAQ